MPSCDVKADVVLLICLTLHNFKLLLLLLLLLMVMLKMILLQPYYPYREFDQQSDPATQPKLNYLAPEYGLTGCCDVSSDMFSVGMLVYAIYNKGNTLYDCMADWRTYKMNASDVRLFYNGI